MEVRYSASFLVKLNNAVMRILASPGNGDNGVAGSAKTPVDSIFVEVYEFDYLICGLK